MPGFAAPDWRPTLSVHDAQALSDIDKVFALLDGKQQPAFGLVDAFCHNANVFDDLKRGKRVSLSYFDVRYYKGKGTIHFFPRRADLVDRLNRLVGQHRQWLPQDPDAVSDAFWRQYEEAEAMDADVQRAFAAEAAKMGASFWSVPRLDDLSGRYFDSERAEKAQEAMRRALEQTLVARGIDTTAMLLPKRPSAPALAAPAEPAATVREDAAEKPEPHETPSCSEGAEQLALI